MSSRNPCLALSLLLACGAVACGPTPSSDIGGVVVGADGQPIEGARVRVQADPDLPGAPHHVVSGSDGRFRLPRFSTAAAGGAREVLVTAGKDGWKNGSASCCAHGDVAIVLQPIPPAGDTGYRFQSGAIGTFPCFQCHGGIVLDWQLSTHSTASLDALVLDAMGPYLAFVDSGGDLGKSFTDPATQTRYTIAGDRATRDECARCHAPAHAQDGQSDFRAIAADPLGDHAVREGVTCDVCHKIRGALLDDLTRPGLALADLRLPEPGRQVIFGPLDDSVFSETEASYAPAMEKGEICAPCHSNARVLALAPEGGGATISRRVYGEDTFREWRHDPATVAAVETDGDPAASGDGPYVSGDNYAGRPLACQDCHMRTPPDDPKTGEALADVVPPLPDWQRVATHIAAPLRHPSQLTAHGFEGATPRMVAWATELRAAGRRAGGEIVVDVELENRHTGHDFPSGLPDRNSLLLVTARDGDTGQVLAQTAGPTLPPWAGAAPTTAGRGYARWLASPTGEEGVFYAFAVRDAAVDSRLRPGAIDRSTFRFAAPAAPTVAVDIEVKVLHRRRFPHQIDAVKTEVLGDLLTMRIP